MKTLRVTIICLTAVICTVSISGTFFIGLRDYEKRMEKREKLKQQKKFQYNDPSQPDSQVNDPERFWYA
jgi:hypothetical protein